MNIKGIFTYVPAGVLMLAFAAGAQTPVVTSSVRSVPRQVLSNEGIVALSEAGYDQRFLVDLIRLKQTRFDTSVDGLAYLADHGIPDYLVRFMIANSNKPAALDPVAAPIMVPLRAVRQRVLVPDTRVPSMGGQPYQSAPSSTQQIVLGRDNRWYVVGLPDTPVAGSAAPVNSYINYFPAW